MSNEETLIALFCLIDDFCKSSEPMWQKLLVEFSEGKHHEKSHRKPRLSTSEILTILIYFHQSGYRTFKQYYNCHVRCFLNKYFLQLVSYSRIVQLMSYFLFPLFLFLQTVLGACSGISFVDSTLLTVCHNRRIHSHQVFKKLAKRGKTSTGWFYGFKLHLIINDQGEILAYMLTGGNIDDRAPVKNLCQKIFGMLFGDKGYISSNLFSELYEQGVQLITKLRANMKNKLIPLLNKLLLKKRGLIESVHNRLKYGAQIEHHRHRSPWNFLINLLSGLASYSVNPNKPSLRIDRELLQTF